MRSQTLNASRYTNGTLAKIMAEATNFISTDYNPDTNTGTFIPSTTRLTPSFSGGIKMGGWEYLNSSGNWTPVVSGEHGITASGDAIIVSASSDLFSDADASVTIRLVGSDPEYWDSVTLTREVSPLELYKKANTKITQSDEKIALIASSEELAKYSTLNTMSKNLSTLEQTSKEFRQTVTGSYATKTYADGKASAAQSAAISAAASDATTKANAAETNAKNYTTSELTKYSTIQQTDSKISTAVSTKVGETEVKSIIEQEADNIRLKADKIAWQSNNSSMTEDGVLSCKGANISGDVQINKNLVKSVVGDVDFKVFLGATTPEDHTSTGLITTSYMKQQGEDVSMGYDAQVKDNFSNYQGYLRTIHMHYQKLQSVNMPGNPYGGYLDTFDEQYITEFQDATTAQTIRRSHGLNITLMDTQNYGRTEMYYGRRKSDGKLIFGFYDSRDGGGAFPFRFESGQLWTYGNKIAVQSSSSRRYKEDISPIDADELDPHRLYSLEAVQFRYKDGAALQYEDMKGQTIPGFIAEDVEDIYPAAVIHKDGEVESWDERRIIPGMLALIQEQKAEIDELRLEIADIKTEMEALKNEIHR